MFYAEDFLIGKEPTEHEKCCHVSVSVRHIGIPKHWYVLFVCVLSSVSLGGGVDPRSCPLCAALGLVGCIQSPLTTLLSQIQ